MQRSGLNWRKFAASILAIVFLAISLPGGPLAAIPDSQSSEKTAEAKILSTDHRHAVGQNENQHSHLDSRECYSNSCHFYMMPLNVIAGSKDVAITSNVSDEDQWYGFILEPKYKPPKHHL